ncbi:MAG: hypothetical protein ACYDCK_14160 [Thermoplasmatota archaeon]
MTLERAALEAALAHVNGDRREADRARVAAFAPTRFTLEFPDVALPDGRCVDEDFVAVQFALKESANLDSGIVGARFDEEARRYFVEYEIISW